MANGIAPIGQMWPWEHAVVGYLAFTILSLGVRRRPPSTPEAVVVAIGTQLPDLVDKPLGWTLGVLPGGRTLGHSLVTFVVLGAVVGVVTRRLGRQSLALPLLVGYLVGILTDLPMAVLHGDVSRATFLVWPLRPSPHYPLEQSFLAHLGQLEHADVATATLCGGPVIALQVAFSWYLRDSPADEPTDH